MVALAVLVWMGLLRQEGFFACGLSSLELGEGSWKEALQSQVCLTAASSSRLFNLINMLVC